MADDKLKKLKDIVDVLEKGSLSREDVAKAFGVIFLIIKALKEETEEAINSLEPVIKSSHQSAESKATIAIETASQVEKQVSDDIENIKSDIDDRIEPIEVEVGRIHDRLDEIGYDEENKDDYIYELTDFDKGEIIGLLTREFPKEKLQKLEELVKQLEMDVIRIKNIPSFGGTPDFGAPFETVIKAGANITVYRDQSGAWVISSSGGGGSNVDTITNVSTDHTVAGTDGLIQADASAGSITLTMPSAATVIGIPLKIKKVDSTNNWVLIKTGIDGASNYYLAIKDQEVTLTSNGTEFKVTGGYKAGANTHPDILPQLRPYPSTIITEFQTSHGYTGNGTGTFTLNDTADFIKGTQAVKIVTNAAGGTSNLSKLAGTAVDATKKFVRFTFKIDDITHLNRISLFLGSSSLANNYKWFIITKNATTNFVQSGEYMSITVGFHDAIVTGSPLKTNLTDVRVQVTDDAGGAVTVHVQSIELIPDASPVFPNGVVSIVFDDSYESPYTYARPELDKFGYTATLFTIMDYIGTSTRLTLTQLQQLQDQSGWEISGHAFTDANHVLTETAMSEDDLDSDLRNMRDWLSYNGFKGMGLAYPQGKFTPTTIGHVKKYFNYGRTILYSDSKETFPAGDPHRLRAITAISSLDTAGDPALPTNITKVGGQLDLCKANTSWLILVFHDIVTSTPGTTSQCLQSDFVAIVDAINTKGIPCMSIADVLKYSNIKNGTIRNEVVAGSGTTFTLAVVPQIGTEQIFVDGQRLTGGGVDYTISGAVITLVTTTSAGTMLADYLY